MRTHELATFLGDLSAALSHLPDVELTSLPEMLGGLSTYQETFLPIEEKKRTPRRNAHSDDLQETLAGLSKTELVELINKANVPVEIRKKDSAKYAARKISTHLTKYPVSARNVRLALRKQGPALTSKPLSKALETLLGNRNAVPATEN